MRDFVMAALPWVVIGLAVAVFMANCAQKEDSAKSQTHGMAIGMSVGILAGIALSAMGVLENDALGIGIGIGMLWGIALGGTGGKQNEKDGRN